MRKNKTIRKGAARRAPQQNAESIIMKSMLPHMVQAPADPPIIIDSVTVIKAVGAEITVPSEGYVLTPAQISSWIPGGQTYWSRMRIEKVNVWGSASSGTVGTVDNRLQVQLESDSSTGQPPMEWSDSAIIGQSRPRISFKLGLLARSKWYGVADTTEIARISQTGNSGNLTIQVTVAIVSPATV